jgi:hypothetical protein
MRDANWPPVEGPGPSTLFSEGALPPMPAPQPAGGAPGGVRPQKRPARPLKPGETPWVVRVSRLAVPAEDELWISEQLTSGGARPLRVRARAPAADHDVRFTLELAPSCGAEPHSAALRRFFIACLSILSLCIFR